MTARAGRGRRFAPPEEECVLVATDEDPLFDTPLGDWCDVERNLRAWGAVCEAEAGTVEALVRKARGGGGTGP